MLNSIGGDCMDTIESSEELRRQIVNMNQDNSVLQFSILGKGKFTLVLQEEAEQSIKSDSDNNPQLKKMIQESRIQYKAGKGMSTSEILDSITLKAFE